MAFSDRPDSVKPQGEALAADVDGAHAPSGFHRDHPFALGSLSKPGQAPGSGPSEDFTQYAEARLRGKGLILSDAFEGPKRAEETPFEKALIHSGLAMVGAGSKCFAPRAGSQYSAKDVPNDLGCASCMSNIFADAVGPKFNYRKMHEVGVERWLEKFQAAGFIQPTSEKRSGGFIVGRNAKDTGHPHVGLMYLKDGVWHVIHNQPQGVVDEPLSKSKFATNYGNLSFYRAR